MRTVTKHNAAQIRSRKGRYNISLKSVLDKEWQITGMVNVCMGQEYIVYLGRRHRDFLIFVQIRPLFHPAVYQNMFIARFQKMAASRHFMCRTYKS